MRRTCRHVGKLEVGSLAFDEWCYWIRGVVLKKNLEREVWKSLLCLVFDRIDYIFSGQTTCTHTHTHSCAIQSKYKCIWKFYAGQRYLSVWSNSSAEDNSSVGRTIDIHYNRVYTHIAQKLNGPSTAIYTNLSWTLSLWNIHIAAMNV